jgi:hypothetical protein
MMQTKRRLRYRSQAMLLAAALFWARAPIASGQNATPSSPKEEAKNAEEFKEFLDRVRAYVTLHKTVASSLPALKPTALPEMIKAHEQALGRKIREARPHAKRGDIFSEKSQAAFRRAARDEFRGPQGRLARKTIQQGEPLKEVHVRVNEPYPDGMPFTTVPPTLLLKFPKLPDEVAYRIVGRDLILLDVEANLVIDNIQEIFPPAI